MEIESRRVRKYERALTRQYDRLVVSSPLDRNVIGEYANIHVVRNGINLSDHPFTENGRDPGSIVFTGRMGYFPNADAAIWFATNVFPLVRSKAPDAQFFVVGADPTPEVQNLAQQPGVVVTGYVDRIQDYLAKAMVAVAPMQGGSGMQFKVLEAMCSGAPVVATPFALGGIEIVDGEHLLVAQSAEAFAVHTIELLQNQTLQTRVARHARQLVEENYSWEQSVAMLENVYRLAIKKA